MGCVARIRKGILQTVFPQAQINQSGPGHDAEGVERYDGRSNIRGSVPGTQDAEANNGSYFERDSIIKTHGQ